MENSLGEEEMAMEKEGDGRWWRMPSSRRWESDLLWN